MCVGLRLIYWVQIPLRSGTVRKGARGSCDQIDCNNSGVARRRQFPPTANVVSKLKCVRFASLLTPLPYALNLGCQLVEAHKSQIPPMTYYASWCGETKMDFAFPAAVAQPDTPTSGCLGILRCVPARACTREFRTWSERESESANGAASERVHNDASIRLRCATRRPHDSVVAVTR